MTMLSTLEYESRRVPTVGDRYLGLLAAVLLGYALMGKGFAYIGLPPLYIGEIAYLIGVLVLARSGACLAMLATLPSLVLAVLMIWAVARTVPFLDVYGVDALRDSVLVLYGGFAFIVIGLLLEDARRIDVVVRYYSFFVGTFPIMLVGYAATRFWQDYIPSFYGPNIPILDIQATAVGMHLAGAAVFVLAGYRKASPLWLATWLALFSLVGTINRGALLSVFVPVVLAMLVLGRLRLMLAAAATVVALIGVAYTLEATYSHFHEAEESSERPVSAHQVVDNIKGIFGEGGEQLRGTKQWRLDWWDVIIEKTFHGSNFWTGRGFGVDLARADGFETPPDPSDPRPPPPSRSPHSAHLNLLARTGMPGLALWLLLLVSWGVMMLRAIFAARSRGHEQWVGLFLFVSCYVLSIIINASFDVVLEGPMQGIWFWCLFGLGIASVMVYRSHVAAEEPSPDQ
ncbi:MAG: hypothetical protein OJF58_003310 [Enhydrobacter sp.]|jgi:hypothetical protein|nr:MAG: hypothetical protein OJF58_003310 [Enhydrobacter sp.]